MSSRRQRSIPLGVRYRQVSRYHQHQATTICKKDLLFILKKYCTQKHAIDRNDIFLFGHNIEKYCKQFYCSCDERSLCFRCMRCPSGPVEILCDPFSMTHVLSFCMEKSHLWYIYIVISIITVGERTEVLKIIPWCSITQTPTDRNIDNAAV